MPHLGARNGSAEMRTPSRRRACGRRAHEPSSVPTFVASRGWDSFLWDPRHRGPRATLPGSSGGPPSSASLFRLAPSGVCRATDVTAGPVSSYLTLSPSPSGSLSGAARQTPLCGTVLGVTPTRRYLALCPVVLGLSSPEPDRGRARERIPEPLRRAPHSLGALVWQRRCGLRVREVGG